MLNSYLHVFRVIWSTLTTFQTLSNITAHSDSRPQLRKYFRTMFDDVLSDNPSIKILSPMFRLPDICKRYTYKVKATAPDITFVIHCTKNKGARIHCLHSWVCASLCWVPICANDITLAETESSRLVVCNGNTSNMIRMHANVLSIINYAIHTADNNISGIDRDCSVLRKEHYKANCSCWAKDWFAQSDRRRSPLCAQLEQYGSSASPTLPTCHPYQDHFSKQSPF